MTIAEIDVSIGDIRAIPIPLTTTDQVLLTSDAKLYGWSIREASGDAAQYTEGSVTTPGAGATICQLTGLPAGTYTCSVVISLAGTPGAGDVDNFELVPSSGPSEVYVNPGAVGNYPQADVNVTVGVAGSIAIKAIAAGTAGAEYSATLQIKPTVFQAAAFEIQDSNSPLGEGGLAVGDGETQWFGPLGIRIAGQIKLHVVAGTVVGAVYAGYYR